MINLITNLSDEDIKNCINEKYEKIDENKNNSEEKKNNINNEKIFLCFIYYLYIKVYNIINDIYKNNIQIVPFLNKRCCECRSINENKMLGKNVEYWIKNTCFLHGFKYIDTKKLKNK